jgi:hypothetical protein
MSYLTKGKPKHTEYSKKLLSESRIGKESSFKGKSHTDESKKALSLSRSKPCISPIGERFASTKEAGIAYKISSVAIRNKIQSGKSGWRYELEEHQLLVELKRKPKKSRKGIPQSKSHIENRMNSRLSNDDYYKDRQATIKRMSDAKLKNNHL